MGNGTSQLAYDTPVAVKTEAFYKQGAAGLKEGGEQDGKLGQNSYESYQIADRCCQKPFPSFQTYDCRRAQHAHGIIPAVYNKLLQHQYQKGTKDNDNA